MLKKKRIMFRGKPATRGTCKCGGVLIIEDPDANKHFKSYHQDPMCADYLAILAESKEPVTEEYGMIGESEYEK